MDSKSLPSIFLIIDCKKNMQLSNEKTSPVFSGESAKVLNQVLVKEIKVQQKYVYSL
jgi:hypothetical protein